MQFEPISGFGSSPTGLKEIQNSGNFTVQYSIAFWILNFL